MILSTPSPHPLFVLSPSGMCNDKESPSWSLHGPQGLDGSRLPNPSANSFSFFWSSHTVRTKSWHQLTASQWLNFIDPLPTELACSFIFFLMVFTGIVYSQLNYPEHAAACDFSTLTFNLRYFSTVDVSPSHDLERHLPPAPHFVSFKFGVWLLYFGFQITHAKLEFGLSASATKIRFKAWPPTFCAPQKVPKF